MLLEGRPRAAARRKNRWSASRTWAINAGQPGGSEQCHRRAGLGTGLRRMKAKAREHLSHLRVGKSERVHARTQRRGALAPEPLLDHAHVPGNMLSQVSRKALADEDVAGTHLSPLPVNSHRTVLESLVRRRDIQDIVLHVNPKPAYLPVGAQDSGRGEPPGSDCPSLALTVGDPTGPFGGSDYWSRI